MLLSQNKQHLPGEFLLPDAPHDNMSDNPYAPFTRTTAARPASAGTELLSLTAVGTLQDGHRAAQGVLHADVSLQHPLVFL